jgi:hypothetical protein
VIRLLKIFLLVEWLVSLLVTISLTTSKPSTALVVFALGCSVVPLYVCHFVTGILLRQLDVNGMPNLAALKKSWWFDNFTLIHPEYLKWVYGLSDEPRHFSEINILRMCTLSHGLGFVCLFITLVTTNIIH